MYSGRKIFLFLLNNVFIATNKPITKTNKTGFILYIPLNSHVKNTFLNFFSTLGLIGSIKNI